jgi:hypothetical protein
VKFLNIKFYENPSAGQGFRSEQLDKQADRYGEVNLSITNRPVPYSLKGKSKGKVLPLHTIKAHIGRRGIAPLILNLGIR